jgi:hypothetical protein
MRVTPLSVRSAVCTRFGVWLHAGPAGAALLLQPMLATNACNQCLQPMLATNAAILGRAVSVSDPPGSAPQAHISIATQAAQLTATCAPRRHRRGGRPGILPKGIVAGMEEECAVPHAGSPHTCGRTTRRRSRHVPDVLLCIRQRGRSTAAAVRSLQGFAGRWRLATQ